MDPVAPALLARPLLHRIDGLIGSVPAPVIVGLDGRSGSGKSTLAAALEVQFAERGVSVTVLEGDGFYGGGSAPTWDARSAADKVGAVMDWRRQRDVLGSVRVRGWAEWAPFDWDSQDWDTDEVPLSPNRVRAVAATVVVLEGAYSCRPELHDLLDLRVLLQVPETLRRRRLLEREGAEYRADWDARWSAAEAHYFSVVAPPATFDLVIDIR